MRNQVALMASGATGTFLLSMLSKGLYVALMGRS